MKKKWLISVLLAYIIIRIYIATLSSYGFYHGWNEGYYSLIAKNYFSGSLWEQIAYPGGTPFVSVPPMFSYVVFVFFKIFGISDMSARLVSIFSEVIAVLGVYILTKELYDEKTACISAVIFIFIPWNILWFGRAQTDPLMTALMILAIALYVYAYKNNKSMFPFGVTLGFAVLTKQPALAVLPIVFTWSYFQGINRKQVLNAMIFFLIGLIPLLLWFSYYAFSGNYNAIYHTIFGELAHRSEPFSDLARVVMLTAAGLSPLIIVAAAYQIFKERDIKNILVIWLLLYGTFVLIRTPQSHEYYSLPLVAPVAIMAGLGIERISRMLNKKSSLILLLFVVIFSMIPFTYILLSYSGDTGYRSSKDAGSYLGNYMDKNSGNEYLVLVQMKYSPQIAWYAGLELDGRKQIYSTVDELSVQYVNSLSNNSNKKEVFLVADEKAGKIIINEYEKVYGSSYKNNIVDLIGASGLDFNVEPGLIIFKIR